MLVRPATSLDQEGVHSVHWSAFDEGERELVAKLAVNLLSEESTPAVISLVAETEGDIVGHVAFSPLTFHDDPDLQGYILAPLAVKPEHQRRHVGSSLIESGMQQLSDIGADVVLVYGDPKYYGRFGFSVEAAERFVPPYKLEFPFGWQGIAITDQGKRTSPTEIECVRSLCDPAMW